MPSPTTLQSQPASKPARRARKMTEGEELGKKPKKVNSEIRKQQNRIASRNYREKRKRKLQYLQQLINDGSNDEQTPEASPQHHEAYLHTPSTEYDAAPSSPPFMLASSNDFMSLSPSSTTTTGPIPTSSSAAYGTHLLPNTQAYASFEMPWSHVEYNPPSAMNIPYTASWTSGFEQSSRQPHQVSPPIAHAGFGRTTSPYHHPGMYVPTSINYPLHSPYGNFDGSQHQMPGTPSVSLPDPFSYPQGYIPGPH